MKSLLPPIIVTHAGSFHSDELMAIVLLERFYLISPLRVARGLSQSQISGLLSENIRPSFSTLLSSDGYMDHREPVWVVRTRNPEHLAFARNRPDVFVVDVGGVHDPDRLNLDHHQAEMTLSWPSGTPLSSTGLVWQWLEKNGHLEDVPLNIRQDLVEALIEPLDAHDNGVRSNQEAEVIDGYNRVGSDHELQLAQFEKVLDLCRDILENALVAAESRVRAKSILVRAWQRAKSAGEDFVLLTESLPGGRGTELLATISEGKARLLGIPSQSNRYSLISLPIVGEDRFTVGCPVPDSWRGRMDFTVEIPDAPEIRLAFAHKTGFMCVVDGNISHATHVAGEIVRFNAADACR